MTGTCSKLFDSELMGTSLERCRDATDVDGGWSSVPV